MSVIAPRIRCIVTNADDLGADATTNDAIFRGMEEGLVTSATILGNGLAVEEACLESRRFPKCSFGVHLNLTEFAPLASPTTLSELLDDRGRFAATVRQHPNLRSLRPAIEKELAAQIDRVMSHGVPVTHFDSHHHIHTVPALLPVLKSLERRFGIYRARISRNFYSPDTRPPLPLRLKKLAYNTVLRYAPTTATTDGFTDIGTFLEHATELPGRWKTIEIELHPGGKKGPQELALIRAADAIDASFRMRRQSYLCVG